MSHSVVIVALPADAVAQKGLGWALKEALEPFNENRETPEYIRMTPAQMITEQRENLIRYRDNGPYADYLADPDGYERKASGNHAHLRYVRAEFPEKLAHLDDDEWLLVEARKHHRHANFDEDGNLLSTRNPNSKWDWYAVGGRWTESVINAVVVAHHPEAKLTETYTQPAWDELGGGEDVIFRRDVKDIRTPFAFLDLDGAWHERGRMGWFGMVADEQEPDVWDERFKELLAKVPDDATLVVVDVHI